MLNWSEHMYIGTKVLKKKEKYCKKLEQGKSVSDCWLITLSSVPGEQLDIFAASQLQQKPLFDTCPLIIGMAGDYAEALDILLQINEEALAAGCKGQLRKYIEECK